MRKRKDNKQLRDLYLFLGLSESDFITYMPAEPKRDLTNEKIQEGILNGDPFVFRYLKENIFPAVLKIVQQHNGNKSQADEVFQDALIVVFKKLSQSSLKITCKFATYFVAVCKTIWKFEHKNGKNFSQAPDDVIDDEKEIEDLYLESREFQLYRKHFNQLKKKQQKILLASLEDRPYSELYQQFGFRSSDVLKNEISRIKKRLIEQITADPEYEKCKGRQNWTL